MSGQESLFQKLKRLSAAVGEHVDDSLSPFGKARLSLDFIWEYLFHGVHLIDYIQYGFYWKKRRERRRFVVHGKLLEIIKTCNDPVHRAIFDQKPAFNKAFQAYLGRDWLDLSSADREDFARFLQGKDQIFIKDPGGMFGQGVGCIEVGAITDIDDIFSQLQKRGALCEAVLTQCRELEEFNASSVNTLRVVTLICADGSVKIMAGVLRVGRAGQIADNFHHHGIAALIDVDTGIVKTTGVDRGFARYVVHPDSGKPIVGFRVPKWDEIVETVKKAALVFPDMRYIGWDVTVDRDGKIVLIEGNPGADPDVTQIPDQVGKWPFYERYLKEIRQIKA